MFPCYEDAMRMRLGDFVCVCVCWEEKKGSHKIWKNPLGLLLFSPLRKRFFDLFSRNDCRATCVINVT